MESFCRRGFGPRSRVLAKDGLVARPSPKPDGFDPNPPGPPVAPASATWERPTGRLFWLGLPKATQLGFPLAATRRVSRTWPGHQPVLRQSPRPWPKSAPAERFHLDLKGSSLRSAVPRGLLAGVPTPDCPDGETLDHDRQYPPGFHRHVVARERWADAGADGPAQSAD